MLSRVDKSARFAVFFRQSPGDFLGSRLVFLETTVFRPTKIAESSKTSKLALRDEMAHDNIAADISNEIIPSSLEDICINFIVKNFRESMCSNESDDQNLELRKNVCLPQAIADSILAKLTSSLKLYHLQEEKYSLPLHSYLRAFSNPERSKLKTLIINGAPMSDDFLQCLCDLLKVHSISEINLNDSNDSNGDDNSHTPPFNHAVLLLHFMRDLCGDSLKKLVLRHTLFMHSIQQIKKYSGKDAEKFLMSTVNMGQVPICISAEGFPQLSYLDVSYSYHAWFVAIDPENPPPLQALYIDGYPDQYTDSSFVDIYKSLLDYQSAEIDPIRQNVKAYPKSEKKRRIYDFFKYINSSTGTLEKYLQASGIEKRVMEYKKAKDQISLFDYNMILRQMHILSFSSTLMTLSLYNTFLTQRDFDEVIFKLKGLIVLDISCPKLETRVSRPQGLSVWKILEKLPLLQTLEVSATRCAENLYDEAEVVGNSHKRNLVMQCDRKPLDVLGLFGTKACRLERLDRLAIKVTGDDSELQLFDSLEKYYTRTEVANEILNKISERLQGGIISMPNRCLELVLLAVSCHRRQGSFLQTCTTTLYYLLQSYADSYTVYQKRGIIDATIDMLDKNKNHPYLARSCMVIFFLFDIPGDFVHDYDRFSECVLEIFDRKRDDHDINIIAGSLCNALVCSMEYDFKMQIRKLPYVETMIRIIKDRLRDKNDDEVLAIAWSALWNVSDETPINSADFINMGGLDLFQKCYDAFPENEDLLRNMMGLLGNIAEVRHLRAYLTEKKILSIVIKLLKSTASGIEVAYNACGIMSNILVEDKELLGDIDVDNMRNVMRQTILSWDFDVNRNINYRSFNPIYRVLRIPGEPVTHLWGVWAINNLVQRDPKYIDLVIKEGGLPVFQEVLQNTQCDKTREFAEAILNKCQNILS